jgi:hypothetical protein
MKTFTNYAAQGDVRFRRVDALPAALTEVAPEQGKLIVTHSETGHHHVMVLDRAAEPSVRMYGRDDPLKAWLEVNRPTSLDHLREHDTHEPIMFAPGIYEVTRQREYTAEGFRKAQD